MKIAILNAGQQPDYLYGLVSGLREIPSLDIEVIDSTNSAGAFDSFRNVTFLNLRGDNTSPQSFFVKVARIGKYYFRLLSYTAHTQAAVFHIQWDNSFFLFDRTVLLLYYKLFRKKIICTAHNVYREERDGKPSFLGWFSLKMYYSGVHRIIVHTQKMKEDLCAWFRIKPEKVFIIPHGINNRVQVKGISRAEARTRLRIPPSAHVILFFGQIDEYKGIGTLIEAASIYAREDPSMVLLIAGKPKRGPKYTKVILAQAAKSLPENTVRFDLRFIPDNEVEPFFASADCVVLPYKKIFQSGIIFLAYRFGVPIIASNIGSFREDILPGITGYLCRPENPEDMALQIRSFFQGSLFQQQETVRESIRSIAEKKYSWTEIGRQTFEVYAQIIHNP